jgi:O-antigen/teichoic acid export membrane protein
MFSGAAGDGDGAVAGARRRASSRERMGRIVATHRALEPFADRPLTSEPASLPLAPVKDDSAIHEERLSGGDVRRRAIAGVATVGARGLMVRGLGLLGTIVLAHLLAPRDFGLIALGFTIVSVGGFLSSGGFGAALIRQRATPSREELEAVLGLQLLVTLALCVVVAAVGIPLGKAGAVAALMVLSLPIDATRGPTGIALERTLSYRPIMIAEVTEMLAYNVFAVAAVIAGAGVWGVAAAVVVRAVVGALILFRLGPLGFVRPRLSWARVRPIFGFGVSFQAVQLVNLVRDQGVNIVTAAVAGFTVLGFWSMAWRLLQAIFLLFESLWKVSMPAMARMLDAGEAVKPVLERALLLTAVLTGVMVVPLAGTAHSLVPVLFGDNWSGTIDVLPWAALALVLNGPLSTVATGYFYAINRPGVILRMVTVHSVVWFVVFVPLLPSMGAEAIGVGLLAAAVSDLVVLGVPLHRTAGVAVLKVTLVPIVAAVAASAVGTLVSERLGPNLGGLVAALMCTELAFIGLIFVAKRSALADVARLARRGLSGMVRVPEPAGVA